MIPDIEKIVSDYLRAQLAAAPELDGVADVRVVSKTPSNTDTPWIRLIQLDDTPVAGSRADHLVSFLLQLDIYAGESGGRPEASLINRVARRELVTMSGRHADAVITGVQPLSGPRIPDDDGFEPARERFIRTVIVWAHPAPA